jgi:Gas vesicle synthesis protein GvpO
MTERRTVRRTPSENQPMRDTGEQDSDGEDTKSRSHPSRGRAPSLTAAQAAQEGLREIAQLTGKQTEGVTGVEPAEDGWIVGVEVVEDRRVPSSADVLATYEAEFDMDGELLSYRRVKRYSRGRGDSSGEA